MEESKVVGTQLSGDTLPLPAAALRLHMTREMVLRRVQLGHLEGGQRANGRWFVLVRSIEQYERERADA